MTAAGRERVDVTKAFVDVSLYFENFSLCTFHVNGFALAKTNFAFRVPLSSDGLLRFFADKGGLSFSRLQSAPGQHCAVIFGFPFHRP